MKFSKYNLIFKFESDYLLVNTYYGSLYRIDEEYKKIIEEGNMERLGKQTISDYYKKGIIVDDEVDERRIIKYYQNKEKYCTQVLSLTILLTMECNFRCVYCFEGSKTSHKLYLEQETKDSILKFIRNTLSRDHSIKVVSITLFGGEPLLNIEDCAMWLKNIKDLCQEYHKQFTTGIVTNGALLSNENLDILAMCNCSSIQVTVDGTEEIHDSRRFYVGGKGTFKDVIKGIKLAAKRNDLNKPIIRINIDKSNVQSIGNLLEYLADEGLNNCEIDFSVVKAGQEENKEYSKNCFTDSELGVVFETLWRKMEKLGIPMDIHPFRSNLSCGLYSDKSFTICPDGKVYKCWEYVEDDRFFIGNIDADGEISSVNYHFYDWMTKEFGESNSCNNCVYLPVCGGGCAAVSFEKNKNIHSNGCHKIKGVFETKVKLHYLAGMDKELI